MGLSLFLLALAAVFFWAGFLQPPRFWRYKSRNGFVVMLALAGLAEYFAWRSPARLPSVRNCSPGTACYRRH